MKRKTQKLDPGWLDEPSSKRLVANREYITIPTVGAKVPKLGDSVEFELPDRPVFFGKDSHFTLHGRWEFQVENDPDWNIVPEAASDGASIKIIPNFATHILESIVLRVNFQNQSLDSWVQHGRPKYEDWHLQHVHPDLRHLWGPDTNSDISNFVTMDNRQNQVTHDNFKNMQKCIFKPNGFKINIRADHPIFQVGPISKYGEKIFSPMADATTMVHVDFIKNPFNLYSIVAGQTHTYRLILTGMTLNLAVPRLTQDGSKYFEKPPRKVIHFPYPLKLQRIVYMNKQLGQEIKFSGYHLPSYVLLQKFHVKALQGREEATAGQGAYNAPLELKDITMKMTFNGKNFFNDECTLELENEAMQFQRQEQFLRSPPFRDPPNPTYRVGKENQRGYHILLDLTSNPKTGELMRAIDANVMDDEPGDLKFVFDFPSQTDRVLLMTLIYPNATWVQDLQLKKAYSPLLEFHQ